MLASNSDNRSGGLTRASFLGQRFGLARTALWRPDACMYTVRSAGAS